MPYNVPVENVIAAGQAVKNPEMARSLVEGYEASDDALDVELPDYASAEKSRSSKSSRSSRLPAPPAHIWWPPPCRLKKNSETPSILRFTNTLSKRTLRGRKKMGVEKLPSMYINGELKWSSIIPSRQEYFDEIRKYL